MRARSHETGHGPAVRAHHVVGVVHVLDIDGDRGDVCHAIEVEMERCGAHALLVDLTGDDISEEDAAQIIATLGESQVGEWHTAEGADRVEAEGPPVRRLWHDDGREILIRGGGAP
ncbi:MAG TPA: hypothetical protein VLB67_00355 [Acidimicrobiia bacterium]|nr:hypothetical protein [Acidimicrobiia bacterium]